MNAQRSALLDFTYSPIWNVLLLTAGSFVFTLGTKGVAAHHGFVTGGIFGTALLLSYMEVGLSAAAWYFLLNVPLFILGWVFVSRRFFFYSLYAMLMTTLFHQLLPVNLGVHNQLYAAVAGGVLCGGGTGMMLRSLGSGGGLDVAAVILNRRYGLGVGKFFFMYNAVLFLATLVSLPVDLVIASLILVFISSTVVEYVLALFNQRKIVFIISEKSEEIAKVVLDDLKRGATFLKARGAFTGRDRNIIMSVINNIQLKRLEELVFTTDPDALFIVENTFSVLGRGFAKRKMY
ncbi:YitT family protein [Desulfovibrio aminophilus]|uniref:YitT family protein n=1 Tax=Desulfovibrio aminophilus TaxID=81425 RepID=UPI003396D34E